MTDPDASLRTDRPVVTRLAQFSQLYETDHYRKLADGMITRDTLDQLADELVESQVDKDIHVDNDPRENAGHAYWQRRPFGADPQPVEPVASTVYAALVDDPPSLGVERVEAAARRAAAGGRLRPGARADAVRGRAGARRARRDRSGPARPAATRRSRPRTPW